MTREKAAEQARGSFSAFVDGSGHRLLQTAFLMTGNQADAQDAVQSVLERLYVVWPRVDDPLPFAHRMLANHCSNDRRGRARRRETPLESAVEPSAADGSAERAQSAELLAGLRTLPGRQRAVLVLRYFDGLSEAEISDLLECSRGSVKTHAARGLKSLNKVLRVESPITSVEGKRNA